MPDSSKPVIRHIVTMGDSLSDRGTLYHRYLFNWVPMSYLAGLSGNSPKGRFTNGLVWDDVLASMLSADFALREYKTEFPGLDSTDISDDILDDDAKVRATVDKVGDLNSDRSVSYQNKEFMRNYNEGGLSAHSYRGNTTLNLPLLMTRRLMATLGDKRKKLLEEDLSSAKDLQGKKETLVIEWSGANDLLTVNSRATELEVDKAIEARMENIRELYANGYRHFVLINLPDISLTPRFQTAKAGESEAASKISDYHNEKLAKEASSVTSSLDDVTIEIFDIESLMREIYASPQEAGFDAEKRDKGYIQSADFKARGMKADATGYMFWDDIHPSAQLHGILARKFYDEYTNRFDFVSPVVTPEKRWSPLCRRGLFARTLEEAEACGIQNTFAPLVTARAS